MILIKILFCLTCVFFNHCGSFSVDSLIKCSIKDNECQKNSYQNTIKEVAKNGYPELGIPKIDPIILKDVSVSILDLVNLTMVDGVAKGIRNCIVNSFKVDIEKKTGSQEITCDLVIKGHYLLSSNSSVIAQLLGNGELRGDGKGKVELEQLHASLTYPFYPERHADGEIYMKCSNKDIVYKFDVKGKTNFAADNIYLGKEDVSDFVNKYINQNGKLLLRTMGKPFIDKAMEFYFDFAEKFFNNIPAKYFIIEDMSPYL